MKDTRYEMAVQYHRGGSSCSAAVLAAFASDAGMSETQARREAGPYAGGGRGTCGAVAAAEIVLRRKYGAGEGDRLAQELDDRFRGKNGSVMCREIRGRRLRSCRGCVEDAAELLAELA
ncbi:MAG: C_GCAxxG_C_C family protein [Lachnospiraceae bacterium]|nr:C_GCAxxG_C_C family protein [Lachnospiraceae bacterium]